MGGKTPAEIAIAVAAQILQIQQHIIERGTRPMPVENSRLVRPAAPQCSDRGADCTRLAAKA
jgi:hypothetical protein